MFFLKYGTVYLNWRWKKLQTLKLSLNQLKKGYTITVIYVFSIHVNLIKGVKLYKNKNLKHFFFQSD